MFAHDSKSATPDVDQADLGIEKQVEETFETFIKGVDPKIDKAPLKKEFKDSVDQFKTEKTSLRLTHANEYKQLQNYRQIVEKALLDLSGPLARLEKDLASLPETVMKVGLQYNRDVLDKILQENVDEIRSGLDNLEQAFADYRSAQLRQLVIMQTAKLAMRMVELLPAHGETPELIEAKEKFEKFKTLYTEKFSSDFQIIEKVYKSTWEAVIPERKALLSEGIAEIDQAMEQLRKPANQESNNNSAIAAGFVLAASSLFALRKNNQQAMVKNTYASEPSPAKKLG
jgi:hypothetical protein